MYAYKRMLSMDYDTAVARFKEELQKEGFGILTEIDVQATIKKKLGLDFDRYVILGACNPPFAHRALLAERDVGVMMPCNVVVYEQDGKTYAATTLPTVTMGAVQNVKLAPLADEVETKLKKALDAV
jgi:uncharacterized protein (DUF302 family)